MDENSTDLAPKKEPRSGAPWSEAELERNGEAPFLERSDANCFFICGDSYTQFRCLCDS
jgi:hypothetical protein